MTEIEIKKLTTVLFTAFPHSVPPDMARETGAIYAEMLGGLDFAIAQTAVRECLKIAKRLPPIADVLAAYSSVCDAIERERSKRQIAAPMPSEDDRSVFVRQAHEVIDAIDRSFTLHNVKREQAQWRDTQAPAWKQATQELNEACGQCACCRAGRACVHVLQLSAEDRADLGKLPPIPR